MLHASFPLEDSLKIRGRVAGVVKIWVLCFLELASLYMELQGICSSCLLYVVWTLISLSRFHEVFFPKRPECQTHCPVMLFHSAKLETNWRCGRVRIILSVTQAVGGTLVLRCLVGVLGVMDNHKHND